jgi:hypothetical protein
MILSGVLSTMNIWANDVSDIRFSLNDLYMSLLMNGWMFLFMGLFYKEIPILCLGIFLVILSIWCIRTQFMVTGEQYIMGMIPHHSMAVLMSKRLLEKGPTGIDVFVQNIIKTQESEIKYMKTLV